MNSVRARLGGVVLSLVALLIFIGGLAQAQEQRGMVVPGQYLIQKKSLKSDSPLLLKLATDIHRPQRYNRFKNLCHKIIRANPQIDSCVPNFIVRTADNDPFISTCSDPSVCNWGVDNAFDTDIDLPQAWQISEGTPEIVVAVLDTGLDLTQPDILDNLWTNADEIAGNNIDDDSNGFIDDIHGVNILANTPPQDDNGHGTHVSGIIASTRGNNLGIAGVAPKIKILPVKFLDKNGNGNISDAIRGLDYIRDLAINRGIKIVVVNNSWGGFIPSSEISALSAAFSRLDQAGILATVAAGNGGFDQRGDNIDNLSYYPPRIASLGMITVAATNISGRLASFSNFGPNLVQIAAPGESIRSLLATNLNFGTNLSEGTALASGTSMSTPFVSGAIALVRSLFPNLTYLEVKSLLLERGYLLPEQDRTKVASGIRLNALYALTSDEIPTPTPIAGATDTPTPLPTLIPTKSPTITPTPSSTPTPQPTLTPTSTLQTNDSGVFRLKVIPMEKFSPHNSSDLHFSAKRTNLITVEIPNLENSTDLALRISNNACQIAQLRIAGTRSVSAAILKGATRSLKQLTLEIFGDTNSVALLSQKFPVRERIRSKIKISCKNLKGRISFLAKS